MNQSETSEIGYSIRAGEILTNYHDIGEGFPVVLLHGSGPGVTAWANWRRTLPALSARRRVIAPDVVGFGHTERPQGFIYDMESWRAFLCDFLDALQLKQVDLVGNSFGGALALALAIRFPERVRRLVLMGSVGVPFTITPGLDAVWGYEPSIGAMKDLIGLFSFDRNLATDDLAELRYRASIRPGYQESYASMFPAPRQRWVDAMVSSEADIRSIGAPTLIIHGREDRVIPVSNSLQLLQWIDNARLHVFGRCGHWTQIEHAEAFCKLLDGFLS